MKETAIVGGKSQKKQKGISVVIQNSSVQKLLVNITYVFLGVLISNGAIFGEFAPFGVAYVSAVPYQSMLWASAGTILGDLLMSGIIGYRYIGAIMAVIALRWVFSEIDVLSRRKYFAPAISFVPLIVTGIVVSMAMGFELNDIIKILTEALLAATASYFFTKSINLTAGSKGITSLSQQELACLAMSGCIILLSFGRVSVAGLSVGRVLAVLLVLICSRYGGISGGCITGVATGIVFGLSMPEYGFLAAAYSFGGLLGGLMSSVGKVGVSVSFLLSSIIVLLQSNADGIAMYSLYEMLIASSVFMLLPKNLGSKITAFFSSVPEENKAEGLRKCVLMRLDYASKALSDVSDSVNAVSKKLSTVYSPEKDNVYTKAIDSVCSTCGLRVYCWEKSAKPNECSFESLTEILKEKKMVTEKDIDEKYPKKCCKSQEMADSITNYYELCAAYTIADKQINEVRGIVSEEFKGLSELLEDLSNEFRDYEYFDSACAERVGAIFKMEGLVPLDVACRINKYNRMSVEVIILDNDKRQIKKTELVKAVSSACGRKMDSPCISYAPDRCRIQFNEKPIYDLQIASAQHISGKGTLCGDCMNYFTDGMGKLVSIISDGMGTGGRAAVDGNMAAGIMTKLIKAGLSFDCSLNIVNSALIVKSSDESLATLDVTSFDMFTGSVEFLKAGAPMSYIKRGSNLIKIEAPSLPAGILRNISFAKKSFSLNVDDCIIMLSDGIVSGGDKWLEARLKNLTNDFDIKNVADDIIREAVERCSATRDDDMSGMIVRCMSR